MKIGWVVAGMTKYPGGFFETMDLIARQRLARVVVGGREMTHQPVDAHVAKAIEEGDEFA